MTPNDLLIPAPLRIVVPVVHSKKNSRKAFVVAGRPVLAPSKEAAADEQRIRDALLEVLSQRGELGRRPLHPDADVCVRWTYHVHSEVVEIEAAAMGPRPQGVTGRRRDLQGMIDTICDGLQGWIYHNDNQVAKCVGKRVYD